MKTLTQEQVLSRLPRRPLSAHKGTFGKVLVIAGSRTMCGAGYLCALSALSVGAGMVFWALPKSMQPSFAAVLPEVITLPLPETDTGEISAEAWSILKDFSEQKKPSLAVIGPGMGKSPLFSLLMEKPFLPLVIDADALNWLSVHPEKFPLEGFPAVLTPHPGEMARLLGLTGDFLAPERPDLLKKLIVKTGGICLLKGRNTLVGAELGGELMIWQNTTGGPSLAKAGSGDVLSGIIAGLWAQTGTLSGCFNKETALQAALAGVYIHGLAGDLAAREQTEYGVLARSLVQKIPFAMKEILR